MTKALHTSDSLWSAVAELTKVVLLWIPAITQASLGFGICLIVPGFWGRRRRVFMRTQCDELLGALAGRTICSLNRIDRIVWGVGRVPTKEDHER